MHTNTQGIEYRDTITIPETEMNYAINIDHYARNWAFMWLASK